MDSQELLLFRQVTPVVYVYQLNEEGPGEEIEGEEAISSFQEWLLPAKEFQVCSHAAVCSIIFGMINIATLSLYTDYCILVK